MKDLAYEYLLSPDWKDTVESIETLTIGEREDLCEVLDLWAAKLIWLQRYVDQRGGGGLGDRGRKVALLNAQQALEWSLGDMSFESPECVVAICGEVLPGRE
jgi:hypothetical protein